MKFKDIFLATLSAVIPTICLFVLQLFDGLPVLFVLCVSVIISSVALVAIHYVFDRFSNSLQKYSGQWVEEMIETNSREKYIGIGIIRYDKTTKEYIFLGKTYSLDGIERYTWCIDSLRPTKDNEMKYICLVETPRENSIGLLSFANKNEASGNISVYDGKEYTHNAYRITDKMIDKLELDIKIMSKARSFFSRGQVQVIKQSDYSKFAQRYSERRYN